MLRIMRLCEKVTTHIVFRKMHRYQNTEGNRCVCGTGSKGASTRVWVSPTRLNGLQEL